MTTLNDPTLLSVETSVGTSQAEEGFAAFLEKMTAQSGETAKILRELGGQLESLVDTVISKTTQARDTANRAQESVSQQQKTIQEKLAELKQETQLSLDHIEKLYSEYGIKATGSIEAAAASYEKAIRQIKEEAANPHGKLKGEEAKALLNEFEEDLKAIRARIDDQKKKGITDLLKEKGPSVSVAGDLGSSIGAVADSALSAVPSMVMKGGLVGLLLYGMGSAEALRAQTAAAALAFRKDIGDTSSDVAAQMGGSISSVGGHLAELSHKLKVSEAELGAVYGQMGRVGVSAEDAGFTVEKMSKASEGLELTASGLQANLGALSIAMDKTFGMAIGTSMSEAVKVSQEMGLSVKDTLEQMAHLRMQAEASGIGIDRYVNSVMTASKSLSQFGIDIGATTQLMDAFTQTDKEMGGSGARAARGMQGVGQLFSNLQSNVGMTAYLGEKVYGGDPVEARRKMLMAFGNQGEDASREGRMALGSVLEQVQGVGKSTGGGAGAQDLAMEKVFGIDFQTAEMIRNLKPEQIEKLKSGEQPSGLSESEFAKLAKGFESSKDRENSFKEFIKSLMNAIRDLLMGLVIGVGGILAFLTGNTSQAKEAFGTAWTLAGSAMKTVASAGKQMGDHAGEAIGLTGGPTPHAARETAAEMVRQQAASQANFSDYGKRHAADHPGAGGSGAASSGGGHGVLEHDPATGGFSGTAVVKIQMSPQALKSQARAEQMKQGTR
jgi:hypothetical protein